MKQASEITSAALRVNNYELTLISFPMCWAESHIRHSSRVLLRRYLEKSSCSSEFGCCKFIKQPKLAFYFLCYFLWRIIKLPTVFKPRVNICYHNIHFESNCDYREREEKINNSVFFSAIGRNSSLCPKLLPSRQNKICLWKLATKVGMYPRLNSQRMGFRPLCAGQMGEFYPLLEPIILKDL